MTNEITVSLIMLIGSILGTFGGVMASSKLVNHRIEQLEKKVDKHNCIVERTFVMEEQMKVANHRISDLEGRN